MLCCCTVLWMSVHWHLVIWTTHYYVAWSYCQNVRSKGKQTAGQLAPVCELTTNTHRVRPDKGYGSRTIYQSQVFTQYQSIITSRQTCQLTSQCCSWVISEFLVSIVHRTLQSMTQLQQWNGGVSVNSDAVYHMGSPPVQYCKHMIECSDSELLRVGALTQVLHLTGDLTCHPPMDALEQGVNI